MSTTVTGSISRRAREELLIMGRREVERWTCDYCGKEEDTWPVGRVRGWIALDFGIQWPGAEMPHVPYVLCCRRCLYEWTKFLPETMSGEMDEDERNAVDGQPDLPVEGAESEIAGSGGGADGQGEDGEGA